MLKLWKAILNKHVSKNKSWFIDYGQLLMESMQTSMLEEKEKTWLFETKETQCELILASIPIVEIFLNLYKGENSLRCTT